MEANTFMKFLYMGWGGGGGWGGASAELWHQLHNSGVKDLTVHTENIGYVSDLGLMGKRLDFMLFEPFRQWHNNKKNIK